MKSIWEEQTRHIGCIQDVAGLQLYTVTGHITKAGVQLPVFRCARGSTSLESFHCHLVRFIPGTSANAVNFQAYLLDGISRWNSARSSAATQVDGTPLRTFDTRLQSKLNDLSLFIHDRKIIQDYVPPGKFTGEKFGVEYLFQQSGDILPEDDNELQKDIDEGFSEDLDIELEAEAAPLEEEIIPSSLPERQVCLCNNRIVIFQ